MNIWKKMKLLEFHHLQPTNKLMDQWEEKQPNTWFLTKEHATCSLYKGIKALDAAAHSQETENEAQNWTVPWVCKQQNTG